MINILLTNDDGYASEGLWALYENLRPLGNVVVVAPDRERSAVSHSITLTRPLRITRINRTQENSAHYVVDGTPADCVKIALVKLFEKPPDLVISGINRGANTGINILYSGTVAGAAEGTIAGIPSIAISRVGFDSTNFHAAALIGRSISSLVLKYSLPDGVLLNVNVPKGELSELGEFKITRSNGKMIEDDYIERTDPRKNSYFWLQGKYLENVSLHEEIDDLVLRNKNISLTPITIDRTAHSSIDELRNWDFSLTQMEFD